MLTGDGRRCARDCTRGCGERERGWGGERQAVLLPDHCAGVKGGAYLMVATTILGVVLARCGREKLGARMDVRAALFGGGPSARPLGGRGARRQEWKEGEGSDGREGGCQGGAARACRFHGRDSALVWCRGCKRAREVGRSRSAVEMGGRRGRVAQESDKGTRTTRRAVREIGEVAAVVSKSSPRFCGELQSAALSALRSLCRDGPHR